MAERAEMKGSGRPQAGGPVQQSLFGERNPLESVEHEPGPLADDIESTGVFSKVGAGTGEVLGSLEQLEVRGALAFDAPSCELVRGLIARAERLGGRASALLAVRAGEHVARLANRLDSARAEAVERIEAAERCCGALPEERAALERGELTAVRLSLRRRVSRPFVSAVRSLVPHSDGQAEDYESTLTELASALALARAEDTVHAQAGPYNPLRIASDLLERIRAVSPLYLNAQLRWLGELANLIALPEHPDATLDSPSAQPQSSNPPAPADAATTASGRKRSARKQATTDPGISAAPTTQLPPADLGASPHATSEGEAAAPAAESPATTGQPVAESAGETPRPPAEPPAPKQPKRARRATDAGAETEASSKPAATRKPRSSGTRAALEPRAKKAAANRTPKVRARAPKARQPETKVAKPAAKARASRPTRNKQSAKIRPRKSGR
jgi:hypothetical protein